MSKKSKRSSKKKRARNKRAQSARKQNPSTSWFNVVSSSPARLWGWIAGMVVVLLLIAVILWFALSQGEPVALTPTAWPTVAAP